MIEEVEEDEDDKEKSKASIGLKSYYINNSFAQAFA